MKDSIESFITNRLVAERISQAHFDLVCRLHRDRDVMKTLSADGNTLSDEVTQEGIQQATQHWERLGFGMWTFRDKSSGEFIGRAGLKRYSLDGHVEIGLGYAVLSEHWNRGFATEMAEACLQIGFGQLGFAEIASWTLPINRVSQRVMEKLGFRYVREFVFAGLPHWFYTLSAVDWKNLTDRRAFSAQQNSGDQ